MLNLGKTAPIFYTPGRHINLDVYFDNGQEYIAMSQLYRMLMITKPYKEWSKRLSTRLSSSCNLEPIENDVLIPVNKVKVILANNPISGRYISLDVYDLFMVNYYRGEYKNQQIKIVTLEQTIQSLKDTIQTNNESLAYVYPISPNNGIIDTLRFT